MAYTRQYTQGVGWENTPSINTPISAENLNQMDEAIQDVDEAAYTEFAAVYAAIAEAGGNSRPLSEHIVSVDSSLPILNTSNAEIGTFNFENWEFLFLRCDVDAHYNSEWALNWSILAGGTTYIGTILDYRDYYLGGSDFKEDIPAGSTLVLALVRSGSTGTVWGLYAIIPASGGGASTLANLSDTHINSPSEGDVLKYSNSGYWVNVASGDERPFSDHIVSVESNSPRLNTSSTRIGNFKDWELFFLRCDVDVHYDSGWSGSWQIYAGGTTNIGSIADCRDHYLDSEDFKEDISAGSILVLAHYPAPWTVWALYAIIPAASGGGGTTVVANPSGTATDTLVKLQVGSTIYEIPGIDTAWAGKVTAVSGGNITPNNASFQSDPFTTGQFIILDIGVNAVMPGSVTSWSLQYTVDGNTVTRSIVDKRDGNAYNPDFDDDLVSGSVIVLQNIGNNEFACFAVLNESGGGGASTLADLTDTNIVTPSDGQLLTYDSTSGKWINASAGGGTGVLTYEIVTKSTGGTSAAVTVNKYVNKSRKASTDYLYTQAQTPVTIDDKIVLDYGSTASGKWTYRLLEASEDHAVGYSDSWSYSATVSKTEDYESQENPDVLDALDDVNLTLPFGSGQPITYDATSGKWANGGVIPIANGGTGNAEGYIQTGIKSNTVAATRATIEGVDNTASGVNSHVEGISNAISAGGSQAHAEGGSNTASAANTHVEGGGNKATSAQAHAEGYGTTASGQNSHTQNTSTTASAMSASAAGSYTTAGYANQFVIGKYNNNKSTNIFEVGIGANANAKANGLELDTSGNLKVAGTITDGNGNVLGGGAGGAPVVWDSATSANDTLCLPLSVAEVPTLTVGGLYVLKIKGDFVAYDNLNLGRTSWGLSITISGSHTAWLNCIASGVDGTGAYLPFTPDIHVGDVITLLCVDATTPKFLVLSSNKDKEYCEATVTTSTSNDVTATFYNVGITANSEIEVGTSGWGIVPSDVTVTTGVCTVTIPKTDSAQSIIVRIYVR